MNRAFVWIAALLIMAITLPMLAALAAQAIPLLLGALLFLAILRLAWPVPRR